MNWLIYGIGFLAQGFFSARILVQWILSERARRVLSPAVFWVFSLCGAWLLCIYGWLRDDFAIVLGQMVSYYVYIYNLRLKGLWSRIPGILKVVILFTPPIMLMVAVMEGVENVTKLLHNVEVPLWLLIYGSAGQLIFTLRFLYQAWYSGKRGESALPAFFWWLSLTGALAVMSYGIFRRDPVLIVGQSFGLVAYIRNLMIGARTSRPAS